jgi:hypothetical protein
MPKRSLLPPGVELEPGESVVRTSHDWGTSLRTLLLTDRRLVCPIDPSAGETVSIPLTEVRTVRLRDSPLGFASVVVEFGPGRSASFPVHFKAATAVAEIMAAVEAAQRQAADRPVDEGRVPDDRYERLRKVGELKASGVLTESEFEREKARILDEP